MESISLRPKYVECKADDYQHDIVLRLIHQHCKNIRNLDIEIRSEPIQTQNIIRSIFSKLNYLHLRVSHECAPNQVANLFGTCTSLEELKIDAIDSLFMMPNMPNVCLLKLSKMHYFCSDGNSYPETISLEGDSLQSFERFLAVNWHIEELNVGKRLSNETVQFISDILLILKKLKLTEYNDEDLRTFASHTTIYLNGLSIDFAYDFQQIFRFKNITRIKFHTISLFVERDLISLVQHLYNLETISVSCPKAISTATIKNMLHYADKLIKFHIKIKAMMVNFTEKDYNEVLSVLIRRENHEMQIFAVKC